MSTLAKISFATALSILSFAGVSHAERAGISFDYPASIDQAIRTTKAPVFNIHNTDWLDHHNDDDYRDFFMKSDAVRKLQEAIASNKELTEALAAQNIEVKHVIGAERALDGSFTFDIY